MCMLLSGRHAHARRESAPTHSLIAIASLAPLSLESSSTSLSSLPSESSSAASAATSAAACCADCARACAVFHARLRDCRFSMLARWKSSEISPELSWWACTAGTGAPPAPPAASACAAAASAAADGAAARRRLPSSPPTPLARPQSLQKRRNWTGESSVRAALPAPAVT